MADPGTVQQHLRGHVYAPNEQSECNECGRGRDYHPVASDGWMRYFDRGTVQQQEQP